MEKDDIIRELLQLEKNVLNLLKKEDDKKQITREIRNIIETARTLRGKIRIYKSKLKDNEDYLTTVRALENKIRLLQAKQNTDLEEEEEEEGVVLNIIHDIQTSDTDTFAQLKQILEEKNTKINQLEQANIDFKAENNKLKLEIILSKLPAYVTKFKKGSDIENIILKLEKKISNLINEYNTTDKSKIEIRNFKKKEIEKKQRELAYFKTYREAGYEFNFFEIEY